MIYKNQAYITIELETGVDLTSASAEVILYKKPNGNTGEWTATVSGTKLTYEFAEGDLNQAGTWRLQGSMIIDSRRAYTDAVNMVVKNLYE